MKTLYFDCSCGASGDMILGALIDAGVDFDYLEDALTSLGVPGFTIEAERINKHGIMATQFRVHLENHHHHPHRHLADVLAIIDSASLPEAVKDASAQTFRRIAECEAAVHGSTVDAVHFHEVGAVDSIVDIVGAHLALDTLDIEQIAASPLNVGSGAVVSAHGVLPVPAPATVRLLEGVPCYGSDVPSELVTPTGAALIAQRAQAYGPVPPMCIDTIGYGSGMRDLADRANVLRVLIGESTRGLPATETIVVCEATIDDMNPELFPPLMADLIANGARDAFLTPVLGKKGRPAYLLTVLCEDTALAGLLPTLFRGSTTLGVRMRTEHRVCLEREWTSLETPWGAIRIKIGRFQGRITCQSPEFEDCHRAAQAHGVPVLTVYDWAHAAIVRGEEK